MKLRRLEKRDAPLMLEWMHDKDVVKDMMADFTSKTLEDCNRFITTSLRMEKDIHLAITDDNDEYMGTVSLKHIHPEEGYAEFAITVRRCAMGHGYSRYAMKEMLRIGLEELGLKTIYWDVAKKNVRAVRFYEKMGANHTDEVPYDLLEAYKDIQEQVQWYKAVKN